MSRTPSFTKAQVRRAVAGAESAGLRVRGVRIYPDGSIEVEIGEIPTGTYRQVEKALAASWDDA